MKYEESSEARNTYAVATSSGSPARPIGHCEPKDFIFSGALWPMDAGISGVQIGPGATAAQYNTHNHSLIHVTEQRFRHL